jgi:hypothetical protein
MPRLRSLALAERGFNFNCLWTAELSLDGKDFLNPGLRG